MLQQDALAILKTGANVFLTGEPGAGKSHTIRQYVAYLRSCGVEPAITASTGIAATHIGGMTIHSWSGIGIKKSLSREELIEMVGRDRLSKRINAAQVLIIDEISMLSGATLGLVDHVCRAVRRDNRAFGGLQIVFVGDFFQLPPVSRSDEAPPEFAFMSEAWSAANSTVCYLSEQHRQEDSAFLSVLSALRTASIDEDHIAQLRARQGIAVDRDEITTLFPHNADVDRINAARLATLPGKEYVFAMSHNGAPPLVEQLQRGCLSPERLVLKLGARVMFTKNHFDEGFVNGTTGEVTGFSGENNYPVVTLRSGRKIDVAPDSWGIEADGRMLASIVQLPLRLAWAMTVHKSQGMSLDAAYVDLGQAFAYGQGYVALSRVRTLAGLYLGGLNGRALEVDGDVLAKDELFRAGSVDAESSLLATDAAERTKQHEAFIAACGGTMDVMRMLRGEPAPRKKKAKKAPNYEQTFALVQSGKSILQTAHAIGRVPGTVLEHLEKLKALDKLPLENIGHIMSGQNFDEIHSAFRVVGVEFLKPAYDHLEGRHPYEAIRLARLFFVA